jgi:hypothetical protein
MKRLVYLVTTCALLAAMPLAMAQQSGRSRSATAKTKKAGADGLVSRMMQFDKNKDGELTKAEVTDARLKRLFDRADADHDGIVTKEELTALAASEPAAGRGGFGPGGFGGPGGPGGPRMGPPRPGEVLPAMLRERLQLTPEQSQQVDALQKEVEAKLAKILSADQMNQLKEMRDRGPGGFGPPPGGFGPGGPPPDGPGGFGPPPRGPDGGGPPPDRSQ